MLNVVGKKFWYFAFSGLIILPGLISLMIWGLNLGIDFTGGTLVEIRLEKTVERSELVTVSKEAKIEVSTVQTTGQSSYLLRTKPLSDENYKTLISALNKKYGKVAELRHETVGPTVGAELLRKSLLALVIASIMIVIYISWAFRSLPAPASSWRFGLAAIVALLHDAFLVLGVFSILGHFFAVEIDSLFVTALLTVIGFSVHDTIVVFDRIRENLNKRTYPSFAETVNHSIMQTIGRSLNTSLTVVFVLSALLLFGGVSIRWFVVALLVGVISGTYSSIFNAAPILVLWQEWTDRRRKK
ncbi:MAG: protein translocase subunit SecF [bacterium]|nr:protein translocase subunit SecF [bacterium]